MVKKELISRITAVLRENNVRKQISIPKRVFHIIDDDGNQKDFKVKQTDKSVIYTSEDIEAILDACMYVIREALKNGEEISVHGFGKLWLKYRVPKVVSKNVHDGLPCVAPGAYIPKFTFGNDLLRSAQIYTQSVSDQELIQPLPVFTEEDTE